MNYLANTLISALGFTRRNQAASDRYCSEFTSMRQLSADELRSVVGGDETGPRGGWKVAATTTTD